MIVVLLFLAYLVLYKAKIEDINDDFFGISSTTAMRGICCLIIILVHIPESYQNPVQDMISSFGYIGVTFFFMTSGYGLKLGIINKRELKHRFWKRRLPKLIIPYIIAMLIYLLISIGNNEGINWYIFYSVGGWVLWLIICYLIFWTIYSFNLFGRYKDIAISVIIILFSTTMFLVGDDIGFTTWTTEIYGFIWGILLINNKHRFVEYALEKWSIKTAISCLIAAVFGVMYLKLKPIYFIGSYVLKIALGIAILTFVLVLTSRIYFGNKIVLYIGGISYEVFLCYGIAIKVMETLMPGIQSGMFIALVMIFTIAVATIVHYFANLIYYKLFLKEI